MEWWMVEEMKLTGASAVPLAQFGVFLYAVKPEYVLLRGITQFGEYGQPCRGRTAVPAFLPPEHPPHSIAITAYLNSVIRWRMIAHQEMLLSFIIIQGKSVLSQLKTANPPDAR